MFACGRSCSADRSTAPGRRRSTSWRLRYERPGAVGLRVDAGQFTSPIGLSILENRPDRNPVVSQHSTLYLPIPRYEAGTPTTFLLAASYPLGAKVTVSGARWDARAAVTDSSPIRGRPFFGDNKPPRMANVDGRRRLHAVHRPALRRRGRRTAPTPRSEEVRDQSRGDRARVAVPGRRRVGVRLHADRR